MCSIYFYLINGYYKSNLPLKVLRPRCLTVESNEGRSRVHLAPCAEMSEGVITRGPQKTWHFTMAYIVVSWSRIYYIYILYYTIPYHAMPCHAMPYHTILYYTILYHTILYYTILYYIYYTILYYTILYYTILYYTILYYTREIIRIQWG